MQNNTNEITVDSVLAEPGGYEKFVSSLFNRSDDESKNFAHAVLGVVTECDELLEAKDFTNGLEEFGDLGFYIVAAMQVAMRVQGVSLDQLGEQVGAEAESLVEQLQTLSQPEMFRKLRTSLEDHAKRWVGYGKMPPLARSIAEACTLAAVAVSQSLLYNHGGYKLQDRAMRANVAKLLERYKGVTFNAEAAINRDTDAERAVLEKHAA